MQRPDALSEALKPLNYPNAALPYAFPIVIRPHTPSQSCVDQTTGADALALSTSGPDTLPFTQTLFVHIAHFLFFIYRLSIDGPAGCSFQKFITIFSYLPSPPKSGH